VTSRTPLAFSVQVVQSCGIEFLPTRNPCGKSSANPY
jgi:hypothetical protein